MPFRLRLVGLILILAIASAWLLQGVNQGQQTGKPITVGGPDYYMQNFSSITMSETGQPANLLEAAYLAHYSEEDLTELTRPYLTAYRDEQQDPLYVTSKRGKSIEGNTIIELFDEVKLWQNDSEGIVDLEVLTSYATILIEDEIAETDRPAILTRRNMITETEGMRAYLKENRLELLNDVNTTILPEASD